LGVATTNKKVLEAGENKRIRAAATFMLSCDVSHKFNIMKVDIKNIIELLTRIEKISTDGPFVTDVDNGSRLVFSTTTVSTTTASTATASTATASTATASTAIASTTAASTTTNAATTAAPSTRASTRRAKNMATVKEDEQPDEENTVTVTEDEQPDEEEASNSTRRESRFSKFRMVAEEFEDESFSQDSYRHIH
jgi:hypothetical protein